MVGGAEGSSDEEVGMAAILRLVLVSSWCARVCSIPKAELEENGVYMAGATLWAFWCSCHMSNLENVRLHLSHLKNGIVDEDTAADDDEEEDEEEESDMVTGGTDMLDSFVVMVQEAEDNNS